MTGGALGRHRAASVGAVGVERIADRLPGGRIVRPTAMEWDRWMLDGREVTAGATLDLLFTADVRVCERCGGEGSIPLSRTAWSAWIERTAEADEGAEERSLSCHSCAGRGSTFAASWIPVRFEPRPGLALLYLPIFGATEARHALQVRAGDDVRCRWPLVRS